MNKEQPTFLKALVAIAIVISLLMLAAQLMPTVNGGHVKWLRVIQSAAFVVAMSCVLFAKASRLARAGLVVAVVVLIADGAYQLVTDM